MPRRSWVGSSWTCLSSTLLAHWPRQPSLSSSCQSSHPSAASPSQASPATLVMVSGIWALLHASPMSLLNPCLLFAGNHAPQWCISLKMLPERLLPIFPLRQGAAFPTGCTQEISAQHCHTQALVDSLNNFVSDFLPTFTSVVSISSWACPDILLRVSAINLIIRSPTPSSFLFSPMSNLATHSAGFTSLSSCTCQPWPFLISVQLDQLPG